MAHLIEIDDGLSLRRDQIAAVRASANRKTCAVFTPGQSAVDEGFLVDRPYADVVDELNEPDVVVEAAKALIAQLDAAFDELQRISTLANDQGAPYSGPRFADELQALREAVEESE
jgi:hypothetical protein